MSQKCLTSWKSPFIVGGIIGTVLLLVGMNLMVGAHVSSEETQTHSPTQKPQPTNSPATKSRYLSVDGPVLVGLGALSFIIGSIVGCVKYFRMHKKEKKKIRRQNANEQNNNSNCNDDPLGFNEADNDGYAITPKSQMSVENTPPSTPLADMVGIMKHPSPSKDSVIITSEINPVTVIKNPSSGARRLINGSPSSPMPLLSPLESQFVFHSLTNASQDKSSSASSSPVSLKGPRRTSWYISESQDSHLVRADYNELESDSSPNIHKRNSSRSSKTSAVDIPGKDNRSDSQNPNLLHPDHAYNLETFKQERTSGTNRSNEIGRSGWHFQDMAVSKNSTDKSSAQDPSICKEYAVVSRRQYSDDSGYDSNKRRSKNLDKTKYESGDVYEVVPTSNELPRRGITKSRNASSSSSVSSEQGSKAKRVTIAVSSGDDTVFKDVVVLSRPQNPVPPKSPRLRAYSTGANRYSSTRDSGRRKRHESYPGPQTYCEQSKIDEKDIGTQGYNAASEKHCFPDGDILRERKYRDSKRAARRATCYGQDWPGERTEGVLRHSHHQDLKHELPAGMQQNGNMPGHSQRNHSVLKKGDAPPHDFGKCFERPEKTSNGNYLPAIRDVEGESPPMKHHSELRERPKTWAEGLYAMDDTPPVNKHLSDLPEVHFTRMQNSRKRRQLPDLELVKKRQSRGSSSSCTGEVFSPGADVAIEDSDDDNGWI